MSLLVDTPVVLELRKGPRCDGRVRAYLDATTEDLFLSVLTLGELRAGVERVRQRDAKEARVWDRWLHQIVADHGERVLPVDEAVVEEWGLLLADERPSPSGGKGRGHGAQASGALTTREGLLAATALAYDLTLLTRASEALERTGARVVDPFNG